MEIMSALMLLVQIWIMYKFSDNPHPLKDPFPENAQSMLSHFVSSAPRPKMYRMYAEECTMHMRAVKDDISPCLTICCLVRYAESAPL